MTRCVLCGDPITDPDMARKVSLENVTSDGVQPMVCWSCDLDFDEKERMPCHRPHDRFTLTLH